MNDYRTLMIWSRLTFGTAAILPLAAACTGNNNAQPTTAANGTAMANAAPPSYPAGYQGAPPAGYPPQPAYAQQPPGYPPQPGYPPPAQPAYTGPTPQPGYAPPPSYPPAPQPQPLPTGGPPAPSGSQTTPGPLAPTDPNTLQGIIQGIQGALQGQLVAPGSVPGDLAEAGLKLHAAHVAPGMQPDGSELKQNLTEGQHAVMMLTLQAGKCYSVVGFSPLGGVKDVDLNLLAPPFYLTLAGQDLTHNSTPVIGASPSPMCPVIAFPLQYKLDVFARSGSGQVLVQLYSKNK